MEGFQPHCRRVFLGSFSQPHNLRLAPPTWLQPQHQKLHESNKKLPFLQASRKFYCRMTVLTIRILQEPSIGTSQDRPPSNRQNTQQPAQGTAHTSTQITSLRQLSTHRQQNMFVLQQPLTYLNPRQSLVLLKRAISLSEVLHSNLLGALLSAKTVRCLSSQSRLDTLLVLSITPLHFQYQNLLSSKLPLPGLQTPT